MKGSLFVILEGEVYQTTPLCKFIGILFLEHRKNTLSVNDNNCIALPVIFD